MKSILIFSQCMELGGVERSLLGLLDSIDYSRYEVDVFLMRHTGELLPYLNKNARLMPEDPRYASLAVPAAELLRRGQPGVFFGRMRGKGLAKRFDAAHPGSGPSITQLTYSHKYTLKSMPPISPEKEYDLVVSFLTPHYFARERARGKTYAAWIHTDYTALRFDRSAELEMWGRFESIASISEAAADGFRAAFPELADRVRVIENILPEKLIKAQAEEFSAEGELGEGGFSLLSVGRFCDAKNFDSVPDICRRVREQGLDARWFLIGYGGDEPLIRRRIAEAGMEKHVIILGKKGNPYPYMRACDLYVQPSRYEGKCVCVREAQLLGRPVVITDYATAASQLEAGVDGVVVPKDNAGCAEGIAALLRSSERMRRLAGICASRDYSGSGEIEKLYALIKERD